MAVAVSVQNVDPDTQVATFVGDASGGSATIKVGPYSRGLCVQRVSGTGTLTVTGSNDGTTFGALSTAISAADDAALRNIVNAPLYLRVTFSAALATAVIVGYAS